MIKWQVEWEDPNGTYTADFGLARAAVFQFRGSTYKWNGEVRSLDGTLLFEEQGETAMQVALSIERRLGHAFQTIFHRSTPY